MSLPEKSVDLMITVHNRAEYTRECLYHLFRNTAWKYVRKLTVYDIFSEDGARQVAEEMLSPFKEAAWEIIELPKAFILDVQNFHIRKVQTPFIAKIDNDIAVPSQWLDAALSICTRHPEVGILGLSPMAGLAKRPLSVDELGYQEAVAVGGIFVARTAVFREAPSMPKCYEERHGFQEWQMEAIPSVTKAWIRPGLFFVLMDMVPFEPWVGLRENYIKKGWQRRGGVYHPKNPILDWWRNNHAPELGAR